MVTEIVVDDAEDRSQGSEAFADRPIAAEDHAVFFKGVGDRIEDEAVGIDFAGGGAVGSTGALDPSRTFHDEVGMPACGPYCGDPGLGQGLAHGYVAAVVDDNAQAGECLGDADGHDLAVLRPHCWLMVGHCAGLRRSQFLGDYVLAHAYVRDDHVLDRDLPPEIAVPAIAEVQVALQQAVEGVTGLAGVEMKTRMRTGTVFTTDDRNWELRHAGLFERLNQARAIAVDMESATIAANGFRFRVPYGTLLCVSDKPMHGEIKLPGMASRMYRERIDQHLLVGIRALELLREGGVERLHSRKLRSFDEPPFR